MSPEEKQDLLRLAAMAIGLNYIWGQFRIPVGPADMYGVRQYREEPCPQTVTGVFWRPLDDDGDCARMEAKLLMTVYFRDGHVSIGHESFGEQQQCEFYSDHGGDRNSARRLASTFVAASIGAAMERDA